MRRRPAAACGDNRAGRRYRRAIPNRRRRYPRANAIPNRRCANARAVPNRRANAISNRRRRAHVAR